MLAGGKVDLGAIRCPAVSIVAETDLIVPPSSSAMLLGLLTGADKSELRLAAGHMALLAGRDAAAKLVAALARSGRTLAESCGVGFYKGGRLPLLLAPTT